MAIRPLLLRFACLVFVLLLGGIVTLPGIAQDRGGPRFQGRATPDTVTAERFDAGRFWSLASPPFDVFEERYGFDPDDGWAEHLRLGVLRLPDCTAALVSARGLTMSSAQCIRQYLPDREGGERDGLLRDERPLSGLYADRLVEAIDVTEEVQAARESASTPQQALQSVRRQLEDEAEEGRRVEVETAAGGARSTAYVYERYEDLRLLFLPEREVSAFGGLEEAFFYPRHSLDVALLRIYDEDGAPLQNTHYFEARRQGVRPGDAVFAVGHPSTTRRSETHAQLAVRRDVVLPRRRSLLERWVEAAEASLAASEDPSSEFRQQLEGARQALKRVRLRLQALQDEYLMTRLQRRDQELRRALQNDSTLQNEYGGLLDRLSVIQKEKRQHSDAYRVFGAPEGSPYSSATFRRALLAYRAQNAQGAQRDTLLRRLSSVGAQPEELDADLLSAHLEALRDHFASDTAVVEEILQGAPPAERARSLVERSRLGAPVEAQELPNELLAEDPALALVEAVRESYRTFQETWSELVQEEEALTRRLARLRFEVRDDPIMPPQDRAPRLTDGRVIGFFQNGTVAPPFTTFYGLYSQHHAFEREDEWALSERWSSPPESIDRSTPLNVAASIDGATRMRGAPLLNRFLQIVGLAFDSNSLGVGDEYMFLPSRMRTVSVDLRGLHEALTNVYEAPGLVEELFGTAEGSGDTSP